MYEKLTMKVEQFTKKDVTNKDFLDKSHPINRVIFHT